MVRMVGRWEIRKISAGYGGRGSVAVEAWQSLNTSCEKGWLREKDVVKHSEGCWRVRRGGVG